MSKIKLTLVTVSSLGMAFVATLTLLTFSNIPLAKEKPTLPEYKATMQMSGTLRSWGDPQISTLLRRWQEGFTKFHPEIRFEDTLKGTATAQWGLQAWVADIALMNREIYPYEVYGTYRRSYNFPVAVEVATGSFDVPDKSDALVIFVHKENPLTQLSMKQLDGIFSAERTGGWQAGLNWVTDEVARGPEGNIRTWGELGLTGEWADKQIIPYGPPSPVTGAVSYFQTRVSGGAGARNAKLREYNDPRKLMTALSQDRYGIGYSGMAYKTDDVKAIGISNTANGPSVMPTKNTVADRTYPLIRSAYIYFTVDTETGDLADPLVDPKVHEFLSFILSKQGQQAVAMEGDYFPLPTSVAREQILKIENPPTTRFYRKDRR